jgi:hypothetical protein
MSVRERMAWALCTILALGLIGSEWGCTLIRKELTPNERIDRLLDTCSQAEAVGKDSLRCDTIRGLMGSKIEAPALQP